MTFINEHTLPALNKGLEKNANAADFCTLVNAMIITGETEEEMELAKQSVKNLLGFYGSTPAYKPPMEAIGYGDLQPELNRMSKEGKWDDL